MAGNFGDMMKLMQAWNVFKGNHPKFPAFVNALRNTGIEEGTIIAISVTPPGGQPIESNIRVTESDLELFKSLSSMQQ